MAARLIGLALASFSLVAPVYGQAVPEPAVTPQVENSRFQFAGKINASRVMIRSGPSENYYPVLQVDKGLEVRVVGIQADWLKIVPPEGSFSVVAKQYVNKEADGSGTLTGTDVRVRCGSSLTAIKTTVQCRLNKGDKVTILGEQDEYYQIKPPADAYVYVHQKFVDPIKQLNTAPVAARGSDGQTPATQPATRPAEGVAQIDPPPVPPPANNDDAAKKAAAAAAKTAEAAAKADAEYDRLQELLKTSLNKPLDERPVEDLISGFEKLLASDHLSVSMRRIMEVQLIGLRSTAAAKAELAATRKQQAAAMERIAAIRAEREAVEQKRGAGITVYTAVGVLKASTLQVGNGTLYRVTDPATDRTLCYVRNNDPAFVKFLDKFVGVQGDLTADPQLTLKVVNSNEAEIVDQARVNKGVTALVSPPSLLPKPAGPTTQGN